MTSNKDKYIRAALKAANWFVQNQIIEKKPNWDANHGRFPYHVHLPSGYSTMGLNWTMARAVMVLLSAYNATKKKVYFESAAHAIAYNKTLQILDARDPNFGAIHEETPQSPFCYPRDAIETIQGFLMFYRVTDDKDLLYRADIYLKWYLKKALLKHPEIGKWTIPEVRFDGGKPMLTAAGAYQGGGGKVFYNAYLLMGKPEYKKACITLADGYVDYWLVKREEGAAWHMGANDDGAAMSLLSAYKLTGNRKYLDSVKKMMDRYVEFGRNDTNRAGLPCTINTMIELTKLTGDKSYNKLIQELLAKLLKRQSSCGGFRGEDEPVEWHVKGADPDDFVVTRVTAYAGLALFKAAGLRGYGYTVEF